MAIWFTTRICMHTVGFILSLLLAGVAAANAAEVTNLRIKGDTTTALFQAADPLDPCLENLVSVTSADKIETLSPPGSHTPAPGTVLVVVQRDVCTGFVLFSGAGDTASHSFQVAGNLGSATLTATVLVVDAVSQQGFTFQVNLVWTATGNPQVVHSKETFRDPDLGIRIRTLTHSRQVEAVAIGTVVTGGVNFTPEASDTATIHKENAGSLVIEKTP
jgi:hypothetical protein